MRTLAKPQKQNNNKQKQNKMCIKNDDDKNFIKKNKF